MTGPPEARFRADRWDMMRPMTGLAGRAAAAMIAAALLFPPEARAQAPGGLSNLFGGIFSSPAAQPAQPAPGAGGAQPGSAPQAWSGEDGASGHPLMTADA